MQRYFNYSLLTDVIFAIIIGLIIYYSRPWVQDFIQLPKSETLNVFNVSMITVSATLMGFLLTIVTVIVTFKNSFKEKINNKVETTPKEVYEIPQVTVFEKKIKKENIFYNTPIHKAVIKVFISATYEIAFVLFCLMAIQFNIIYFSTLLVAIINFCIFILLILTLGRSLYIFHLFLNVHLHQD